MSEPKPDITFKAWNKVKKEFVGQKDTFIRGDGVLMFFFNGKLHEAAPHYLVVFNPDPHLWRHPSLDEALNSGDGTYKP